MRTKHKQRKAKARERMITRLKNVGDLHHRAFQKKLSKLTLDVSSLDEVFKIQ